MASRILLHRLVGHDVRLVVHLDDTRMRPVPGQHPPVGDPDWQPTLEPDPGWCLAWTFGDQPPAGVSTEQYQADYLAEVERQVSSELARRAGAGVVLGAEGQPLGP